MVDKRDTDLRTVVVLPKVLTETFEGYLNALDCGTDGVDYDFALTGVLVDC